MKPSYVVEVIKGKKWYWRLVFAGKTLAHSEQYSSKYNAEKTARNLAIALECRLEVLDSTKGSTGG